jgi:sRNA-binding protein
MSTQPSDPPAATLLDAPAAPAPEAGVPPASAGFTSADCAAKLAELFPALFGTDGPRKPVKLHIHADIQQRVPGVFTRRVLSAVLARHTTTTAYLKALVNAPYRCDLDGQPAGEIADDHRKAAADELARRKQVFDARREAEREARRTAERQARREHRAQQQERQADDQARRERMALLRAFETTTLTKANFCALKGIAEADLDARLEQARKERAERPASPRPAPHGATDRTMRKAPRKAPRDA